ncbi:hypothetical protein [Streptomyces sp. SAI-129]|uniref:hypothetical protein n=1 Tax=Streptomyces sp. SAI-129 TaxID=3377727 RepID=UPI003C7C767C
MFRQHTSHPPPLSRPSRVLTPADYGGDTERERSFAQVLAQRETTYAASRTDARLCAELERPMKQISRQVRALKQSPHFKA